MTEIESNTMPSLEVEPTNDDAKDTESVPEHEPEKDKENVAPSECKQFNESGMVKDMKKLWDLGEAQTKRQFRAGLEKMYSLEEGELRKTHNKVFKAAYAIVKHELEEKQEEEQEEPQEQEQQEEPQEQEQQEEEQEIKKKKRKKKRKKNKKSRKRKRPCSDDDDADCELDNTADPPKKKRKTNSSKSVDADADNNSKKKATRNRKKSGKKRYAVKLTKLRRLLKVTGLANPKLYKELKGKKNKKQVDDITKILKDNGVETSALSDRAIKKIAEEFALKREMEDLGINLNEPMEEDEGTSMRSRRNRTNVSYVTTTEKIGSDEEDEDVVEDEEEEEEEEDRYEPSEEDNDYDYDYE
eukprot:417336_1